MASEFVPVLRMLVEDESLSYSYPSVREVGLTLLAKLDLDSYNLFNHTQYVCQALKATCSFLMEQENLVGTC